MLSKEKETER